MNNGHNAERGPQMPRGKGMYVDDDDSDDGTARKVADERAASGDPTPDVEDPPTETPD